MNTFQFLAFLIVLNFFIGLSSELYVNPTAVSFSRFDDDLDYLDSQSALLETDLGSTTYDKSETDFDKTAGNTFQSSFRLIKLFWKGLLPIPFPLDNSLSIPEQLIFRIINLFRIIIGFTTGLLIFMLVKNRKNN